MGNSPTLIEQEVRTTATQPSPPWSPWAALIYAVLLGPLAGLLVAYRNLRSLGLETQARTLLRHGMIGCAFFAMLIVRVPRAPMTVNLVVSLAAGRYFHSVQELACKRWMTDNAGRSFKSGWLAIGWGVLGGAALWLMAFLSAYAWGE